MVDAFVHRTYFIVDIFVPKCSLLFISCLSPGRSLLIPPPPLPSILLHVCVCSLCSLCSQGAVYCVWSCFILVNLRKTPKVVTLENMGPIPYENRALRTLIDSCAFHIYGHWVKRYEEQNRAALFETTPKRLSAIQFSL